MTTLRLREAVPTDLAAMQHVARRAYAPAMVAIDDLPNVVEGIAEDLEQHSAVVAEVAGQVAGIAIIVEAGGALKLANMAVDPDVKGRGIAQALMAQVEARARALGKSRLELVTHTGMVRAHGLYLHLGWVETARRGNTVFMAKLL